MLRAGDSGCWGQRSDSQERLRGLDTKPANAPQAVK